MFEEVWSRSFCRTIEKLVEVVQEYPTEVEHIYSPSCVPLVRCAGCCGDEKLECHPTTTTNVTMQVSETQKNLTLKVEVARTLWWWVRQNGLAESCSRVRTDHRAALQPRKLFLPVFPLKQEKKKYISCPSLIDFVLLSSSHDLHLLHISAAENQTI